MADLLDLSDPAPAEAKTTAADDLAAAFTVPAATTSPAAPAAAAPAANTADDDDWGDFTAAPTAAAAATAPQAAAAATAPQVAAAPVSPQAAAQPSSTAGGSLPSTADPVGSFDPMSSSAPAPAPDPFNVFETSEKQSKGNDALISFGATDEFDPVAQQWAQGSAEAAPAAPAPATQAPPATGGYTNDAAPTAAPAPAPAPAAAGNTSGDLLDLGGGAPRSAPVETEELDKKQIFVYHKGEKNCVGWYTDMKRADIKEAILCACDAIMDGGFVLREVQFADDDEKTEPKEDGRIYEFEEFDQLQHGQTYIIEAAGEREDLKKITGDRHRRLKVLVDPLLHVEAVKAIDRMRRGSNLLKHTHYGFPHLRQFQLSDDRKRLVWYSGAKRKEDSVVNLEEVVEIKLGQQTPVFLHYRLPMLEHLSFSLVYGPKGTKTLDLTCKDEFEFDHWVTGLKAIFYSSKNKQISKEALLQHSKRFQKAMEKNNVGIKLTKLPEVKEKGHVGLDDCIEIVTHTPQQLDTKMERLRERLKTMSQQVSRLDHHSAAEMEVDLSLLTGQGPAYASVFVQDEDAQDEEMEIRRMHELVEQTTQILQQARNELIALNQRQKNDNSSSSNTEAKNKKKETSACKHIDQLLWKAEVDLENVEDMYLRHIDNQKETYSLADFNHKISRTFSEIEDGFNQQLDSIKSLFW
eukprot:TRINITY_DN5242_c0_g1_i1.p1 TRINITY_DN5242_c0_g1~~TRINITY_DN5242_c0_g1_i1.p1  ORF type:complete len:712 (-),score=215.57 TRINITY_DN5242_c0_g1_i1:264-2336(-)